MENNNILYAILDCNTSQPLGMKSGRIKITQLKASTRSHEDRTANNGRLLNKYAWNPKDTDTTPWFQVDLQMLTTVTTIVTQGKSLDGVMGYVKTFQVSYGYMENDLRDYEVKGTVEVD